MSSFAAALAALLLTVAQPRFGQTYQVPAVNLVILVVDGSGSPVSGKLVVKSEGDSVLYSAESGRRVTLQVNPGRYRIEFASGFFEPARRDVVVEHSDCLVVLTTHLSRFALETPIDPGAVTVKVTPREVCKSGELLWARLVAVFGSYSAERLIKPAGAAGVVLFEPVEPGTYLLTIVEGKLVRAVTVVNTEHSLSLLTTLDVSLERCESR
jgi:hypothetical protein